MKDIGQSEFELRPYTSDRAVIDEVLRRKIYLKDFLMPFVKQNGLVIDIGAHIGSFTIQSCFMLHPRMVLAIEPDTNNFEYLVKNIAKARVKRFVKPIQIALWNSSTEANLYCQASNPSCNSLIPSWYKWMKNIQMENVDACNIHRVHTDTLDHILNSLHLEDAAINIIKIDVEGAEKQVLEGATNALRRCGVVVGELHEAFLAEYALRKMLKDFVVHLGEPYTSLRLRRFWAVRKSILSNSAKRRFQRFAKAAEMEEASWRTEVWRQQENRINSLNKQLDAIRRSLSWRLTAPGRSLLDALLPASPTSSTPVFSFIHSNPLLALRNSNVRDIFKQLIEERLNNEFLSTYYRLGQRVDSYVIRNQRISRKDLVIQIVNFLTTMLNNSPIAVAKTFWREFGFNGEGNAAGVPPEIDPIETAYGKICQKVTGVVMVEDILKQSNLSNGKIVDVGCASNELNMAILDHADRKGLGVNEAIGTDILQTTTEQVDPRLEFRKQSSSKTLPVESDYADLVISKWSLHHMTLDEINSITSEINRILRPGGKAIIIEALAGSGNDLLREFVTESKRKDVWPVGHWQGLRRNLTRQYLQLQLDQQKAVLALEDYYGHWLESRRTSMALPFTYMSPLEINRVFKAAGMRESARLKRVFGYAPIIHQGPPSVRLVYYKPSANARTKYE